MSERMWVGKKRLCTVVGIQIEEVPVSNSVEFPTIKINERKSYY